MDQDEITRQTTEVIRRFNDAFQNYTPEALPELIAQDCRVEKTGPTPDGAVVEGHAACVAIWDPLTRNRAAAFTLEEVIVMGERAVIRWRYRWGDGPADAVRGLNLMRVVGGKIVEGMGYSKSN